MTWDFDIKAEGASGENKKNFTKFPVGVTRIRILDTAPNVRWTHWMPQYQRSVNCPGRGCPIDEIRRQQKANGEEYTYGMGRRFSINIFNYETGLIEIMEQGKTFFEDVRDLMEELKEDGKTLRDAVLKVKRRGSGKDDTSYRIDIDGVSPIEPNVEEKLFTEVTDLSDYFKPHTPEQILELITFKGESKEAYLEKWIAVTTGTSTSDNDESGEEIEVR